jgi:enoyl-CoA hydratase
MKHRYLDATREGHVVTCTLSNPPHQTLTAGAMRAYLGGAGKTPYECQGE